MLKGSRAVTLPGTFVGEHFQNFGKLGVRQNALPPTIIGGIN
jgi:hypothetical protein